jgi:hypothetical protein
MATTVGTGGECNGETIAEGMILGHRRFMGCEQEICVSRGSCLLRLFGCGLCLLSMMDEICLVGAFPRG